MKHEVGGETLRFGRYLRKLREEKKFSLDTVSELSTRYPEQLTKSHLSRIENGQALPNVPRLLSLSQVYGIPMSVLAERFEIEFKSSGSSGKDEEPTSVSSLVEAGRKLEREGLFLVALRLYDDAILSSLPTGEDRIQLRIRKIVCLAQSEHYRASKEECEDLLSEKLTLIHQLEVIHLFATNCQRLRKYTVAMFAVDQAQTLIDGTEQNVDRNIAGLFSLKGELHHLLGNSIKSYENYSEASLWNEKLGNKVEFLKAQLGMATALNQNGKRKSARTKYLEVLKKTEEEGLLRISTIVLSNLAELAYLDNEFEKAEHYAMKSNRLARPMEFKTVLFRNSFYLWKIAQSLDDEKRSHSHLSALKKYFSQVDRDIDEVRLFATFLEKEEK